MINVGVNMAQRTVLALTDEAVTIIEANATERKRGEFVSNALVAYANGGTSGDSGILERIEARLARIEKLLMSQERLTA
jgi:hypothetical protein